MFLTIFYMIATWVQSWRLSSLRTRLQTILLGPEISKPSIMLYTSNQLLVKDEPIDDRLINKSPLSSHLCNNSIDAKLGDLLWYQGDKWLCTIFPQQKVDVSNWLLYPRGKTIFPLFSHNNAQSSLFQDTKMHVLIEADLYYIPHAHSKATKLEDYGLILTWMTDNIFGVILETDLDHITKFSSTLMQGQCFINNGLPVTRIESVSVSGKPCICNYETFNLLETNKIIGRSQWLSYVQKLKEVSNTAKLVFEENKSIKIKKIPGLEVTPGCNAITMESPAMEQTALINTPVLENKSIENYTTNSSPSSPLKETTPVSTINNMIVSEDLNKSVNSITLDPPRKLSTHATSPKVQKLTLQANSEQNLQNNNIAFSSSSLTEKNEVTFNNNTKRPNILICADSTIVSDNVCNVLQTTLKENKYTVYPLSMEEAKKDMWIDQTNLIIVCGNVEPDVASQVVEYIVRGGKLLALCSDILKIFIPAFKTAEIRENELVRFSYGKWKYVTMLHHIFCYQASPVKTKFSQDLEDSKRPNSPIPVTVDIYDQSGKEHVFSLKVLGSEETWHTPCILLANQPGSGGQAVFSQVHLEVDPFQYEFEENKFQALKNSNATRLEIFSDILSTHLDIEVDPQPKPVQTYSSAFFLGRHELKLEMLKKLKDKLQPNDILKTPKLEIQFCNTSTIMKTASSNFLPVLVHRCPEKFSTVDYFENLKTENVGRLVIYADIMTSSNDIVHGTLFHHGLAVIPYQQTKGQGRGSNMWLSPEGCAMFTLQLHVPSNSILGERISLVQYLTSVAVISAVKSLPGYQDINIKIKWPNDIYTGTTKIGGVLVTSYMDSTNIICNIGLGVNLSNSSPTTCINDIIMNYNEQSKSKLRKLTYEEFLARVFSQIESLLNIVQKGQLDHFYDLYYKYWMHTNGEIRIILPDKSTKEVKILGIDEFGFLEVKGKTGNKFTVHPDGNSFDIFKGLIAPKL